MAEVSTRLCAQFICHEMIKYVWKYIGHSQHILSVLVRTLLAILLCLFPFSQLFVATCSPARDSGAGYIAWGHSTLVGPVSIIWTAVYCVCVLDSLWEDWRILMSLWSHDVSIYQILQLLHISLLNNTALIIIIFKLITEFFFIWLFDLISLEKWLRPQSMRRQSLLKRLIIHWLNSEGILLTYW